MRAGRTERGLKKPRRASASGPDFIRPGRPYRRVQRDRLHGTLYATMLCLAFRIWVLIVVISLSSVAPLVARTPQMAESRRQESRIKWLLVQLADSARLSGDLAFSVRAQTHAAVLLWPQDRECARAIFRRVFESLVPSQALEGGGAWGDNGAPGPPAAVSDLKAELLNQVASRDPELAEEFARRIAYAPQPRGQARASSKPEERAVSSFVPLSPRGEDEQRE